MTKTKVKTPTAQTLVTATTSLTATKQLFHAALSCIAYVRGLFPEENFAPSVLGDLQLKMLKRDFTKENSALLNMLEDGVFDALEQRYLRSMTLVIFQHLDKPFDILESYKFQVSYPDNEAKLTVSDHRGQLIDSPVSPQTPVDLRKQTLRLIRSLVLMVQTLSDLPDQCYLSIVLKYYDQRTPIQYEPKYFKAAPMNAPEEPHFIFPVKVKAEIGELKSPFHQLNLELASVVDDLETEKNQKMIETRPENKILVSDVDKKVLR
jgi:hypothetical protein